MYGYIAYHTAEEPLYRVVSGVRFHAVYVAAGESLRARLSARAAARALGREGVRCAVFPPDYPYREAFAHRGIASPPLAPLYRATAAVIARRWLSQRGVAPRSATVAFAAASATPELRRAAEALCAEVRYIALAVPRGGAELARLLKREHGVAARRIEPCAPLRADLIVDFDGAAAGENVLRLDETLRVAYDSELPHELLAALWHVGALDAGTLGVEAVGAAD